MGEERWSVTRHLGPDHFVVEPGFLTWPQVLERFDRWHSNPDCPRISAQRIP
jgi:hypothetical protein